jgi:hypothetical protein
MPGPEIFDRLLIVSVGDNAAPSHHFLEQKTCQLLNGCCRGSKPNDNLKPDSQAIFSVHHGPGTGPLCMEMYDRFFEGALITWLPLHHVLA